MFVVVYTHWCALLSIRSRVWALINGCCLDIESNFFLYGPGKAVKYPQTLSSQGNSSVSFEFTQQTRCGGILMHIWALDRGCVRACALGAGGFCSVYTVSSTWSGTNLCLPGSYGAKYLDFLIPLGIRDTREAKACALIMFFRLKLVPLCSFCVS